MHTKLDLFLAFLLSLLQKKLYLSNSGVKVGNCEERVKY